MGRQEMDSSNAEDSTDHTSLDAEIEFEVLSKSDIEPSCTPTIHTEDSVDSVDDGMNMSTDSAQMDKQSTSTCTESVSSLSSDEENPAIEVIDTEVISKDGDLPAKDVDAKDDNKK